MLYFVLNIVILNSLDHVPYYIYHYFSVVSVYLFAPSKLSFHTLLSFDIIISIRCPKYLWKSSKSLSLSIRNHQTASLQPANHRHHKLHHHVFPFRPRPGPRLTLGSVYACQLFVCVCYYFNSIFYKLIS